MSDGTATEIVRIGAKLYAEDPAAIDLASYAGIFHGWIQRREPDGLPIDVADYAHVPDGPGVMLIGHEADRAVDLGEGRPGALYQRKRDLEGTLEERFRTVLEGVEWTAARIERDPAADGVRFGRDEILIRIRDRRLAPNEDATLDAVRPALERALAAVYPGRTIGVERLTDDPGGPFRARVTLG